MFVDVETTTLANGMRVISSSLPHMQSAAFGLWCGCGSRHESAKLSGASHFLEHMLFKGTPRRSALEISRAVEGYGGYLNAFTQEESTCYYARVGYNHLPRTVDVLGDMVLNAKCAESDVVKERQVILEEIHMYGDQPQHVVQESVEEALWPRHALGRSILGSERTVGCIDAAALQRYKANAYVPGKLVAAFAGKVSHAACVEQIESLFGSTPRSVGRRTRTFDDQRSPIPVVLLSRDIEQTHLNLAYRVFGRLDARRYSLRVLGAVLGDNMSSRLFQVVREKHGLAYSVQTQIQQFHETGAFFISAGLDRRRGADALALIVRELKRIKEKAISLRELKQAKEYLVGQLRLGLEGSTNQMIWLGESVLAYGQFMSPDEAIRLTQEVTREDVQAVAQWVFRPERASLSMVTPLEPGIASATAAGIVANL